MFKSKYVPPENIDMFVFDSSNSPTDSELNQGKYKDVVDSKGEKKYPFKISTKRNTKDCEIIISASNAKKLRQYLELIKSYGTLKNNLFIDIFIKNLDNIKDSLQRLQQNTEQTDKYHMYFISLYHKMYWINTIIDKITGIHETILEDFSSLFITIQGLYTAKPQSTEKRMRNTPNYSHSPITIFKNVYNYIIQLYTFIITNKQNIQFKSDIIILSIIESENIEVLYTGNLIGNIIMINLANDKLVFTTNIIIDNNDYMKKLIDNNKKKDKEYISELVKASKVINDTETKKTNAYTNDAENTLKKNKDMDKITKKKKLKELKEKAKESLIDNIKSEINKMTNTLQAKDAYNYEDFKAYYIKETPKEHFCIKPDSNYKLNKDGEIKTMLQARHMPVVIHTSSTYGYAINTGTMIDSYDKKKLPKECEISIYCSDLIDLKKYLEHLLKDPQAKINKYIPITIIEPKEVVGYIVGADITDTTKFIICTIDKINDPSAVPPENLSRDHKVFYLPLYKFSTLCIKQDKRKNQTKPLSMNNCYSKLIHRDVPQVPESTEPDVPQVPESTKPDVPQVPESTIGKPPKHTLGTLKEQLRVVTINSEAAKLAAEKEEKAKQEKAAVIAAENYKTQQEEAKKKSDNEQKLADAAEKKQKEDRIQKARTFDFSKPPVFGSTPPASGDATAREKQVIDSTLPVPGDATAIDQQTKASALANMGGGKKTHRR